MSTSCFSTLLKTRDARAGKRDESYEKRKTNIEWIKYLNRNELCFQKIESRVLIHETANGEKIYIQYPGKESIRKINKYPWDFRPIVINKSNETLNDLSFKDIWDVLGSNLKNVTQEILEYLAIIFYRMAYMEDHNKINSQEYKRIKIQGKKENIFKEGYIEKELFIYDVTKINECIKYITKNLPNWGQMSLEAFLFYNDILAWNEDCKYYYRKNPPDEKKENWLNGTGRVNTLLTHVRVLGYLLGKVKFSALLMGFARGRGVSPIVTNELKSVCGKFIEIK